MYNTVRRGVFETNSSSTHSLVIEKCDMLDIPMTNARGVLSIYGKSFGWEIADYNRSDVKLAYLAQYIQQWYPEGTNKNGEKLLDVFERVARKATSADSIEYKNMVDTEEAGFIDHQSVENKDYHYLFDDEDLLHTFLFSPASILHTDNDNH